MLKGAKKTGKINIIDPGHDNLLDPGAVANLVRLGATRFIKEAELNMRIANRVLSLTENYQQTVLTRRWDTPGSVTLDQRVEVARNYADYAYDARFISIHCNSYISPDPSGLEVYYKEGCRESRNLADLMQYNIIDAYRVAGYAINDRGLKTAPFYVLRNNPFPAVLVECGFMSNPVELDFLNSPAGQVAAGYGIALTLLEME